MQCKDAYDETLDRHDAYEVTVLAGLTLDGPIRLAVWVFLCGLAAKTYLAKLQKP